jgi:glutathione S-transferase
VNLYCAPLACSLATRISLYEAGAPATFTRVDTRAHRVADGSDFYAVNPLGQVPVLRTDDGELLTENSAVLQYVAEAFPAAQLMPQGSMARARLREWLSFISTELHKGVFIALLDPKAPEDAKSYAREKVASRLNVLQKHLAGREYLLDRFSIADAYLFTVLNWAGATAVDLSQWPAVQAFHQRMLERPAVARAFGEERDLWVKSLQAAKAQ